MTYLNIEKLHAGGVYRSRLENEFENIRKSGKKICIAPMGKVAEFQFYAMQKEYGIKADCFYDNNKSLWEKEYDGVKIMSKSELDSIKNDVVIIIECGASYPIIKKQLEDDGFYCFERMYPYREEREEYFLNHSAELEDEIKKVEQICEDDRSRQVFRSLADSWGMEHIPDDYFEKLRSDDQYFDKSVLDISERETFVDVGAYTGDTAENFMAACKGKFKKAHLFELDPSIYKILLKNAGSISDKGNGIIQCYPYGLSDKNDIVNFTAGNSNSTIISEKGENSSSSVQGRVVRLDDVLNDEEVSFIKMDIEGAEQSALRGSEKIIKKYRPKLAICIYHSADDMLQIPLYLKSLVPEYKIYIRHYTNTTCETVCYAVT